MLRDTSLVPLSRQHQHALALCVRIDRASPIPEAELSTWQAEITLHFQNEIRIHFEAEERVVFPAARKFQELTPLLDELLTDHAVLREFFAKAEARHMSTAELSAFGQRMSEHIRKEERQLFERLQQLLSQDELSRLGESLDEALKDAAQACALSEKATRLRSSK
jgi:hemerythrin-like domain-containing protein